VGPAAHGKPTSFPFDQPCANRSQGAPLSSPPPRPWRRPADCVRRQPSRCGDSTPPVTFPHAGPHEDQASAPGRSAAGIGSTAGVLRTTSHRSLRSTTRWSTGSTGSTRPPPTASVTPRGSSDAPSKAWQSARTCSPRPRPWTAHRRVVHSLKRDSILREAQASLKRLGVEVIDLYQIHWPIPEEDIEEGWSAFAELTDQQLGRHIGVSNFDVEQLRRSSRSRRSRRSSRSTR
jgi:hypothetical protein